LSINKNKILFSILAGGQSKRFGGGYKTFTNIKGTTILNQIIKKLNNFSEDIIINANNLDEFKDLDYPIVQDYFKGFLGPLAGIHSSILWTKNNHISKDWVFTVPSDTPFLPNNLLDEFLRAYSSDKDIFIARSNKRHHPVIAMWNISLLESLENELKSKNSKIMLWVNKHKFKFVEFDIDQEKNFFNINTQDDLNNAKKINI
tara:strand:- start:484 stop:1092 length:609 start_codon:yes stop_codon:yes gene_type:complete